MSLTKKDQSLRVAANDPHLVSFGGGRLSTAVTIHPLAIGDTTIGSSTACSISLNGTGVQSTHCTIYRSEENEVIIVPERDARILIDGMRITQETNLTQGAMITIGNSNYLRFNNPAEAQMMRSAMGSNERISMPQIDFTQVTPQRNSSKSLGSSNDSSARVLSNGELLQSMNIETFYENTINPEGNMLTSMSINKETVKLNSTLSKSYNNVTLKSTPIDINSYNCPKVFTADLVTVNMPAKDVLGQKYANFAKNLAENHRNDKNINNSLRNNQTIKNIKVNQAVNQNGTGNYVNIPSTSNYIQNTTYSSPNPQQATLTASSTEYLTKVNNTTPLRATNSNNHHTVTAYDRYPKPGTYGGLQIYPMNGVNTDINNGSLNDSQQKSKSYENSPNLSLNRNHLLEQRKNLSHLSNSENERLEDMLKICTEYADRQNQSTNSITSSPIVQNRIKTNGSLPRDKKSPFHHELSANSQLQQSYSGSTGNLANKSTNNVVSSSTGYENVRLVAHNRVEINGQMSNSNSSPKTGYENVVIGKYVPQSPRTKIRTTCMSPKKEHSTFSNAFGQVPVAAPTLLSQNKPTKQSEYEQLIRTFEEKLKLEMQAIEESSRYKPKPAHTDSASAEQTPAKKFNKNINNLTLNLPQSNSLQNSPKLGKKPAPAPRMINKLNSDSSSSLQRIPAATKTEVKIVENGDADLDQLKKQRKTLLVNIQGLKRDISELQRQEDEVLRELDMENALVSAELNSVGFSMSELETQLKALQNKIHRLEAQRNSTRVMEENQQAKLKQSIDMKQDQVKRLKSMLKAKPNNDCLKEELSNVSDSLENDRKTFEDLEFQYLEEESEWHAYREDLHAEEKELQVKIEEKRVEMLHLQKQDLNSTTSDAKTLKNKLITQLNELKACQKRLKSLENTICDITGQLQVTSSSSDEDDKSESLSTDAVQNNDVAGVMSQSLFGSAELLCPKRHTNDDIMSRSVNENMFYNNKIELPTKANATSTPKRPQLRVVTINDAEVLNSTASNDDSLLRLKYNLNTNNSSPNSNAAIQSERVKFNLSLGSDDFEVNPLEKKVPSQDDIDRICKVTLDAPISTKGASTKIFDSIKEIERNRQLLLAQQGHHVIEHERQKMHDLKKKSHDEARAQYLSMLNGSLDGSNKSSATNSPDAEQQQAQELHLLKTENDSSKLNNNKENQKQLNATASKAENNHTTNKEYDATNFSSQQRHSQPEFDSQYAQQRQQNLRYSPRPLSDANSELSCDMLSDNNATCKSNIELSNTNSGINSTANRFSGNQNVEDGQTKRSSVNSTDTASAGSGSATGSTGGQSERKRVLPKHQRPLTRYLPIFSPDLNLRHHIESAGHQIALCPHVFVDSYSCRGYLHKLGATFHGWARRWFVLDRQRSAFIYYADKSERKPRGGAYFSTIDEVYLDHLNASKSGRPHCTLIVKTKKRSYHLQAASDAAARIWIDAIITGAQGNLDY